MNGGKIVQLLLHVAVAMATAAFPAYQEGGGFSAGEWAAITVAALSAAYAFVLRPENAPTTSGVLRGFLFVALAGGSAVYAAMGGDNRVSTEEALAVCLAVLNALKAVTAEPATAAGERKTQVSDD